MIFSSWRKYTCPRFRIIVTFWYRGGSLTAYIYINDALTTTLLLINITHRKTFALYILIDRYGWICWISYCSPKCIWCHQMETFSALLAICAGNSPVPGEFPAQRPVTRSSDVFFDQRSNKRLSKQWRGWWFETQSCPLWRHRNEFEASQS